MYLNPDSFGSYPAARTLVQIILEQDDPKRACRKVGRILSAFDETLHALKDVRDQHAAKFFFKRTAQYYKTHVTETLGTDKLATFTQNVMAYRRRSYWNKHFNPRGVRVEVSL